jgi:HlyD family secretion protein
MDTRKIVTGLVSFAAVGLIAFSIIRALTSGPADKPRAQEVENAKRQAATTSSGQDFRQPLPNLTSGISGQGIVEPADREVKVGSRVPGLVARIFVKEGDLVNEGQVLLQLDANAETAAVSAAKADLDAAIARLSISSLTAKRAEDLARDGAISRDERDRSVSQANIDRAGVDQAKSRLSEAQARLAQLSIKAPSKGTILKLSVRAGEYYSPEGGNSLVTLGDTSKVRVRLDIDERFIGSVFVGQPGYVTVEAYDKKFQGKVVEIAQRMGRKNQRTDDPTERIDTKIREVVMELEGARELVPGLRATGYLSDTKLESSGAVAKGGQNVVASTARDEPPATAPVEDGLSGGGSLASTASVTTGARPATADEWDRRGMALLNAGKVREAVLVYREAAMAQPGIRPKVKQLASQYRDANIELAYCLDPTDASIAAAWASARGQRRALCAESQ